MKHEVLGEVHQGVPAQPFLFPASFPANLPLHGILICFLLMALVYPDSDQVDLLVCIALQ
jgi:hypothetical protein